jgi:hypothetical protein
MEEVVQQKQPHHHRDSWKREKTQPADSVVCLLNKQSRYVFITKFYSSDVDPVFRDDDRPYVEIRIIRTYT